MLYYHQWCGVWVNVVREDYNDNDSVCSYMSGFARLVSGVYACSLLTLLMRVQLSISGGQMFCEVRSQQHHSTEINKQFLSHFLQQGELFLLPISVPSFPMLSPPLLL